MRRVATFLPVVEECHDQSLAKMAAEESYYPLLVQDAYWVGHVHVSFLTFLKAHFAELAQSFVLFPLPASEALRVYFQMGVKVVVQEESLTLFFDRLFRCIRAHLLRQGGAASASMPEILTPLLGWREERYGVWSNPYQPVFSKAASERATASSMLLFEIERSAVALLGVTSYGVHANAVVVAHESASLLRADRRAAEWKMWIAKRSLTKHTYPGLLDQMAAGGLSISETPWSTLLKECYEEAGLDAAMTQSIAVPVGVLSYHRKSHLGSLPKVQYIYDLYLPPDFQPRPIDGEVSAFELLPIESILDLVHERRFKPNCALVIIDFCIRHGIINYDNEPNYQRIVSILHCALPFL